MSPKEPMNIVILGGSFAGLSVAHAFLRTTYGEVESKARTKPRYRIVLVSPSTHLFWNIAAPRALVSPKFVPHSKSFVPILETFDGYPKGRFAFIQGTATSLDHILRKVEVTLCGEDLDFFLRNKSTPRVDSGMNKETWETSTEKMITKKIQYHALIIATGTSAESPLLSLHGTHDKTVEAFDSFHNRLEQAASIIVAGGGPSGVECAGQLATILNGRKQEVSPRSATSQMKQRQPLKQLLRSRLERRESSPMIFPDGESRPDRKVIITLISGNSRLLPSLAPNASKKAETQLRKLGVNIMHNTRLITAQELPSGQTRCVLSDDLSISSDLFLACTGVYPNTSFVPHDLLDVEGYISADPETLRVPLGGDRVYAIGDCTAFSRNRLEDIYDCLPVLMQNLKNDLLTHALRSRYPFGGGEGRFAHLVDAKYMQGKPPSMLVPVTRWGGVGVLSGHKVPGWTVWAIKGRDFGMGKGAKAARLGYNPLSSETYLEAGVKEGC